jgi:hypothetical protein
MGMVLIKFPASWGNACPTGQIFQAAPVSFFHNKTMELNTRQMNMSKGSKAAMPRQRCIRSQGSSESLLHRECVFSMSPRKTRAGWGKLRSAPRRPHDAY